MRLFLLLALTQALLACGGGASVNDKQVLLPEGANVADLLVDSGPDGTGVNRLYTSVTICKPGSTTLCKTIDHVLVDTGSVGLRLLASEVPADLQLSAAKNTNGNVLLGCAIFWMTPLPGGRWHWLMSNSVD